MNYNAFLKFYLVHMLIALIGVLTYEICNASPLLENPKQQQQQQQQKKRQDALAAPQIIVGQMGFKGVNVQGLHNQTIGFGLNTNVSIRQNLTDNLNARAKAGLDLETGSNKSVKLDEYKPTQGIYLEHAFLDYSPATFLNIQVGAINQKFIGSPLLVGATIFLGIKEKLFYRADGQEFFIEAEQAIPNNHTLASRIGSVDEGNANFLLATAGAALTGNFLSLKVNVSYFQFSNLSHGVAAESSFMGNSITNHSTGANAEYLYDFSGLNTGYHLAMQIKPHIELYHATQYLFNRNAPDGRNTGYLSKVGLQVKNYNLYSEIFYNESDSSPAYYNDKYYGHNNRKGMALGAAIEWKKYQLTLDAKYIQANVIEQDLNQSPTDIILFNFMRSYDF